MKKHNKIRRSRENFIYYNKLLSDVCNKHNLEYYCFIDKHMKTYIGLSKKDAEYNEDLFLFETGKYGNELNALGRAIDYVIHNYGKSYGELL